MMVEHATYGQAEADVCLIVEGAYPFVAGGVSSWMHDLIQAQSHLTFHLLVLSADDSPKKSRFTLPPNVIGMSEIALQQATDRIPIISGNQDLSHDLERPLTRLLESGGLSDFQRLLTVLRAHGPDVSRSLLLNTEAVFAMVERMYEHSTPGSSFINYFWSWRALAGGLFSVLLGELPPARIYHAISTGYAGIAMARAALTTGRPGILTEHGIYTNERRVEIAMADWLSDQVPSSLDIEGRRRDLRDVWISAFSGYARTCYEACSRITTLYTGNQILQLRDGAPPEKLQIIPNGVDYDGFAKVARDPTPRRPTVALIGRVVPIKDVKTFIRAAAILRDIVQDVRVLLLGPTDEDPEYFRECQQMVSHLGLEGTFEFLGRVKLQEYLGRVDAIALTSISEAQPLVLLEAGAAGVPSVATDVGSCREIIHGRADEMPNLGPGGFVTPLSNPLATAKGLSQLLLAHDLRQRYGEAIRARTERYYNKRVVDGLYRDLYQEHLEMPDRHALAVEDV
ncbi:GT4 family glycosyltransferase PelF [Microvirga calopogonii]|uniref:GT4 family glycosyltransferase PelF n=1 Tax=Microvirga calopogonii TaxID=2078013 RepID=UPI0013B38D32|nr:GT4 family glycosyltransferase PelF [Microvirga calopogonii]